MTHTIAIAGKGGVGKTTICGMIVDYLCRSGKAPILVVDAVASMSFARIFIAVEYSVIALHSSAMS